jgi:cupin fold WbuC family metalloprotein
MKQIDHPQLDQLARAAQASPRRRMNHNLHAELSDPIQRLAVAMEPDTYVQPHRHPATWELLLPLRGRFVVLNFDAAGTVTDRIVLGADAAAVETAAATWHAVLSLDPGAVIFEVKHGPYVPFSADDLAPWSPAADDAGSREIMRWYATAAVGQRWVR